MWNLSFSAQWLWVRWWPIEGSVSSQVALEQKRVWSDSVSFECKHFLLAASTPFAPEWSSAGPRKALMWALGKGQGLNFGYLTTDRYLDFLMNHQPCKHQQYLPHPCSGFHFESPHHLMAEIYPQLAAPHSSVKLWCEASKTGGLLFTGRDMHFSKKPLVQASINPPIRLTNPFRQGDLFSLYRSQRTGGDQ